MFHAPCNIVHADIQSSHMDRNVPGNTPPTADTVPVHQQKPHRKVHPCSCSTLGSIWVMSQKSITYRPLRERGREQRGWTPYPPPRIAGLERSAALQTLFTHERPQNQTIRRAYLSKQQPPRVCTDVLPRNLEIPRRSWKSFLHAV